MAQKKDANYQPKRQSLAKPRILHAKAKKNRKEKVSYKLNRELEMLPDEIAELESKIARLNTEIEDPSFHKKPYKEQEPVLGEINTLTSQLDEAIARWTELETISSST